MKKIFLGLVWSDDKTPLFHIKSPFTDNHEYVYIPPKINLKSLHERFCIGTINPLTMEYMSCNNKVDTNNCQCNKCKFMFEFYKCVRCHGDDCDIHNKISKDYCDTPHFVYIAYFPGAKLKVGTASLQRKEARLLEQGALYAIYIARTPDGKIARQIEKEVISNGMPSMVSTSYKMRNLTYNDDSNKIKGILIDKYNDIINFISQNNAKYLISPEFKSFPNILKILSNTIGRDNDCIQNQNKYMIEKNIDVINGDYIFAVGKILAIKEEDKIKLIDTKKIEGFNFEFGDKSILKIFDNGGKELGR